MPANVPTQSEFDAALVGRCLAGDERAWAELVGRYDRAIRAGIRTARSIRAELSDEIAAQVWFELFTKPRSLASFDASLCTLYHFLFVIGDRWAGRFALVDWRRKKREDAVRRPELQYPDISVDVAELRLTDSELSVLRGTSDGFCATYQGQLRTRIRRKIEAWLAGTSLRGTLA